MINSVDHGRSTSFYFRHSELPRSDSPPCRLNGEAYDLTKFAKVHPGGAKLITDAAGMDATAIFDPIHPKVGTVTR